MRVKVIRRFADKLTKEIHEVGAVIEVTRERYKDIQRFVEEVKKKSKKK